jgi:hypothetical protein
MLNVECSLLFASFDAKKLPVRLFPQGGRRDCLQNSSLQVPHMCCLFSLDLLVLMASEHLFFGTLLLGVHLVHHVRWSNKRKPCKTYAYHKHQEHDADQEEHSAANGNRLARTGFGFPYPDHQAYDGCHDDEQEQAAQDQQTSLGPRDS